MLSDAEIDLFYFDDTEFLSANATKRCNKVGSGYHNTFADKFTGSNTAMVKQIGNAIPPLMSEAIADSIRRGL